MKLNYKRTILVGFAFFLICAFWQAYDNIIPKILTDKFGMSQSKSGIIMALDNILAIVMLPIFGMLSDKTKTRFGRRTPYILIGTIIAAVAFVGLSFVDNAQAKSLQQVEKFETVLFDSNYEGLKKQDSQTATEALNLVYNAASGKELTTANGTDFVIDPQEDFGKKTISYEQYAELGKHEHLDDGTIVVIEKDRFLNVESYFDHSNNDQPSKLYSDFYVSARQVYSHSVTSTHNGTLIMFIIVLLIVLIAMSIFRSPAVALMPDVTIKPLRSKANAVINLMGSAGGILVLVLGILFKTGSAKNNMMSYTPFFAVVAAIMLIALLIFMFTVREPKFVDEAELQRRKYNIDENDDDGSGDRKLSKGEKRSLILLLASVALWFMGYNAVTSKYSVYADKVLALDYNMTLIIAQAAAIISYIPVGLIASKIGRKKTILAGIVMLTTAFLVAAFLNKDSNPMIMNAMFALAGIAWATINVNSFPMVVELSKGSNVGKFTGYYYTASMAAQVVTPYLSGLLMDKTSLRSLFPYATVFVALAFATMIFVMHGDSKPEAPKGIEAIGADD